MIRSTTFAALFLAAALVFSVDDAWAESPEGEPESEGHRADPSEIILAQSVPARRRTVPPGRRSAPPKKRTSQPRRRSTGTRRGTVGSRGKKPCRGSVTVPLDIGIGPSAHFITGLVQQDQVVHFGGRLDLNGIVSKELLREYWHCVPNQYKRYLSGEVRVKPLVANLIPRELIISPKLRNTGIYGIAWHLFGVGTALITDPVRLDIKVSLPVIKYMYIHSDTLASPTHFLRPGAEAKVELEIPFSQDFLISFGWASQVFLPQRVGGSVMEFVPFDESIWHVGQAFLKAHFRVPYQTSLPGR